MSDQSELVPMPNGGALRRGGKPGHRGGTGRPTSELRQRWKRIFANVVGEIESVDISKLSLSDKLRLLEVSARFGWPGGIIDNEEPELDLVLEDPLPSLVPVKKGSMAPPGRGFQITTVGRAMAAIIQDAAAGKKPYEIESPLLTPAEVAKVVIEHQRHVDELAKFTSKAEAHAYIRKMVDEFDKAAGGFSRGHAREGLRI